MPVFATGSGSGSTGNSRSARRRNGSRLVTSTTSPGADVEQVLDLRSSVTEMLEVVEQEQGLAGAQVGSQALQQWLGRTLADAKGGSDRLRHVLWIGDGGQRYPPDPVGEVLQRLGGCLQGEPGLAGPSWTNQCDEPSFLSGEHGAQCRKFALPADQRGRLSGEVGRLLIEALQGRKVGRQSRSAELKDAFRLDQVP